MEQPERCDKSDLLKRECAGPECRNDVAWFEVKGAEVLA